MKRASSLSLVNALTSREISEFLIIACCIKVITICVIDILFYFIEHTKCLSTRRLNILFVSPTCLHLRNAIKPSVFWAPTILLFPLIRRIVSFIGLLKSGFKLFSWRLSEGLIGIRWVLGFDFFVLKRQVLIIWHVIIIIVSCNGLLLEWFESHLLSWFIKRYVLWFSLLLFFLFFLDCWLVDVEAWEFIEDA